MEPIDAPTADDLMMRAQETARQFDWHWSPTEVVARSVPWTRSPRKRGYYSELLELCDTRGTVHTLFAKTGPAWESEDPYRGGLPGGLAYEHGATALAHGLAPRGSIPATFGFGPADGTVVTIFLEHIQGGPDHGKHAVIARAVDWLTDFQAGAESVPLCELNAHSGDFYLRWIEPFSQLAERWSRSLGLPGLGDGSRLAAHLAQDADLLTSDGLRTVIHGDFYVNNMIMGPAQLVVIDWELAAFGSGPIDLAAITLGWDRETQEQCDARYVTATADRLGVGPDQVRASIAAARRHVIARVVAGLPAPDPSDPRRVRKLRNRLTRFEELLDASQE